MRTWASQVLLGAAGLLSCVDAQAFFGSVQAELDACEGDTFVYLGCFSDFEANAGEFFNFKPQAFITSLSDPSMTFPGWDPGSPFNNTVTPLSCARVCRGFGYKYTSLRDNSCECATQMPLGYAADATAVCDRECYGDSAQTCGGSTDAQVYLDPSFADNAEITPDSDPAVAEFYRYVGCYYAPTGLPTTDDRAYQLVEDIDTCFALCAGMAYPLVYGVPERSAVTAEQHSGIHRTVSIQIFSPPQEIVTSDAKMGPCNSSVPGDCDIVTERCCGQNDVFPVYINTELQGCYNPLLPGFKESVDDPTYDCNDVSDLLTGPPTELSFPNIDSADPIDSGPALIRRMMVSANGMTYYLNGCYGLGPLGTTPEEGVFDIVESTPYLSLTPATLVECATRCSSLGSNAFGMVNGQ
ncbi:WSC domain-containing protein 1 [Madurella mycetomatis]|uniref:WSC domain-containing protein 1 n=1 Tax=Madurella mycetomatis TaxID=100816 RepID=A0A175VSY3_9PEZI|nr:WSC domain-containing protein 1 [Madurella mycetomatis]